MAAAMVAGKSPISSTPCECSADHMEPAAPVQGPISDPTTSIAPTALVPTKSYAQPPHTSLETFANCFTATNLICGNNLRQPCVSSSTIPVFKRKSRVQVLVTVASIGAFSLLLLGATFVYRFHWVHRLKQDVFVDVAGEDERDISFGQIKRFSFREMQLATGNFSEGNIIGQGGYRRVKICSSTWRVKRICTVSSNKPTVISVRSFPIALIISFTYLQVDWFI